MYKANVTENIQDSIINEGYVSFDVDKQERYISHDDMKRFIDDLCGQIAEYIKTVGILSDGTLDSIMMLGLGFTHNSSDIRNLCAEYGLENHFDNMGMRLMEMHKSRLIKDGMLELTNSNMNKMVLQNEHGWYGEKSLSESKSTNLSMSVVASSLGTDSMPMKQIENTNQGAIDSLLLEAADYIVQGDDGDEQES